MSKYVPPIPNYSAGVAENSQRSSGAIWIDCSARDAAGRRCILNTEHLGPHIINGKVVKDCTCTICNGEGVCGSDGEACACVRMGCRDHHKIDDARFTPRKA